jgi:hypothetical protein
MRSWADAAFVAGRPAGLYRVRMRSTNFARSAADDSTRAVGFYVLTSFPTP